MSTLLTEKYRPQSFSDLVLPDRHNLTPAENFIRSPHPSAWLFTGRSGLGKTSLALLMADAASEPTCTFHLVGPDLDANRARELESQCRQRPLFGRYTTFIVDEGDAIPRGGQIRLLQILERLHHSVWIFTSNEELGEFEDRFLSRVRHLSFSTQGLLDPASQWLSNIAAREGIPLDRSAAEKIVRSSKNNLRAALRSLELSLPAQQLCR